MKLSRKFLADINKFQDKSKYMIKSFEDVKDDTLKTNNGLEKCSLALLATMQRGVSQFLINLLWIYEPFIQANPEHLSEYNKYLLHISSLNKEISDDILIKLDIAFTEMQRRNKHE